MEKLSFLGIGPKIAWITLPYLAITIALTYLYPAVFTFGRFLEFPLMVAGFTVMVIALVFYVSTVRLMLTGIRSNKLVTVGAYRLCRNPLYSVFLLFMIPALALLLNSWIILTVTIAGYIVFRKFIYLEEEQLERLFGDEYRNYRNTTSLICPNPFKRQ